MFFERRNKQPTPRGVMTQPEWKAPPQEVGRLVAWNRTLANTERVILNLSAAHVFSTGCMLWVYALCRRADLSEDDWLLLQFSGHQAPVGPPDQADRSLPDRILRFGIEYADGRTTTTLDSSGTATEAPSPPVLQWKSQHADQVAPDHRTLWISLWLWPLPPQETIRLVVEWPLAGVQQTSLELDGEELTRSTA